MQLHESRHRMSPQALEPVHITVHARSSQVTSPQARVPVHVTVHRGSPGPPQSTLPQAFVPTQLTVHAEAWPQLTLRHELAEVHEISQENPAGHSTAPQVLALEHEMVQVFATRLHPPLHWAGHDSGTQNPEASSQVRGGSSPAQS